MSFHHPALLWLLGLPVIWGFWQWTRRGHPVVLPFDYGRQRDGRHGTGSEKTAFRSERHRLDQLGVGQYFRRVCVGAGLSR